MDKSLQTKNILLISVLNFLVNLYLTYSGVERDLAGGFFQVSNLHNVLMIPFFVTMMYCFKVTIIILDRLSLTRPGIQQVRRRG